MALIRQNVTSYRKSFEYVYHHYSPIRLSSALLNPYRTRPMSSSFCSAIGIAVSTSRYGPVFGRVPIKLMRRSCWRRW